MSISKCIHLNTFYLNELLDRGRSRFTRAFLEERIHRARFFLGQIVERAPIFTQKDGTILIRGESNESISAFICSHNHWVGFHMFLRQIA